MKKNTDYTHDPSDDCANIHCWIHNVDETSTAKSAIGCWECGHLYANKYHLRWDHIKLMVKISFSKQILLPGERKRYYLSTLTSSFRKIYSCPMCSHDF